MGARLPNGTRAPTLGWTPVQFSPAGSTSDSCRSGGHLVAALDATVTQSQRAISGWEFNAPRDTSIAGYTIHRTSTVNATHGSRASLVYHDALYSMAVRGDIPRSCAYRFRLAFRP
jgi:hypothetical protein